MPECDPARVLVRPHQMVALGGSEIVEPVVTAARGFQHAKVAGALQGRDKEKRPGRRRKFRDT